MLAQTLYPVQVKRVHPALDRARVAAEPPRDLITAAALGDQQDAVQPVQEMRLAWRLDRGVEALPEPLRVGERKLAHVVNRAQPLAPGASGARSVVPSGRALWARLLLALMWMT